MRDARLEHSLGDSEFDRRLREARSAADQCTESDQIFAGLAQWCFDTLFGKHVIDTSAYAYGLSALAVPLSAMFPEHAFLCVSDAALRRSLETGFKALVDRREHSNRDTIALLFGRALADALGRVIEDGLAPITKHLLELWHLAWSDCLLGHSFVQSLRELIQGSSSARCSILAVIETRIKEINRDPGVGVSVEREEFRAIIDDWRSGPAIHRLGQYRFGRFRDDLLALTADLLPAARRPVLALIDRLDFPQPIHQFLLSPTIWHDRDEISAILEDAPPCSHDGQSWNRRLLALLGLQVVDEHCDALWRAIHQESDSDGSGPQVMDTLKDTLVPWIEQLARTVMARPDGRFLAAQWLFEKVSDERMNRSRDGLTEQARYGPLPRQELIEWVAQGLSNAGLTATTIAGMVNFPGVPISGNLVPGRVVARDSDALNPRFAALVAMCLLDEVNPRARDPSEPDRLDILDGLLASRDAAFELEATMNLEPQDLPAALVGNLVADALEPTTRWRQSWDLLVEQRRRLQHWSKTMDSEALAPSLFLLSVGISGVAWLLSPPRGLLDKAGELWRHVFDQSRDCWLTTSLSHMAGPIERHIHQLFCWHPMVFGSPVTVTSEPQPGMARNANEYSELLAQDLDLLGGDDLMVTICCLNAYRNGASPAIIRNVLELNSGRIRRLVRQFERWQELEGEARERSAVISELVPVRESPIERWGQQKGLWGTYSVGDRSSRRRQLG